MWTDLFKRTYTIETAKSKDSLLMLIASRISEANNDNSWFNLADVDYKKMQLKDNVLKQSNRSFYNPYTANPYTLNITFEEADGKTSITAQATTNPKLMYIIAWSYPIAFLIMGSLMYAVSQKPFTLLIILLGLIFSSIVFLLTMAWNRALIKRYLYNILKDLEIKESYVLF